MKSTTNNSTTVYSEATSAYDSEWVIYRLRTTHIPPCSTYRVVQNSAENRCVSSFNSVITHGISIVWYQKLPKSVAKKCINTKSSCNCSKHMKNSTGTVSSTGFLKTNAYEFGTKSCLRVLQLKTYIINKSTKTCLLYTSPSPRD